MAHWQGRPNEPTWAWQPPRHTQTSQLMMVYVAPVSMMPRIGGAGSRGASSAASSAGHLSMDGDAGREAINRNMGPHRADRKGGEAIHKGIW